MCVCVHTSDLSKALADTSVLGHMTLTRRVPSSNTSQEQVCWGTRGWLGYEGSARVRGVGWGTRVWLGLAYEGVQLCYGATFSLSIMPLLTPLQ